MTTSTRSNFIFFGTPEIAVTALEYLKKSGYLPSLVVTSPDKPKGRGLELSPSDVKVWALQNNVPTYEPVKLNDEAYEKLKNERADFYLVFAYGKIIPQRFLDLPKSGSINIHPSLLPKYRGPSPLQSQILNDEKTIGTSIMLMDAEMDHGPLLAQRTVGIDMPVPLPLFEKRMAEESSELLIEVLPKYLSGELKPIPQDHSKATFCKMIERSDGLVDLSGDPWQNYLKYLAFTPWPGTYYFEKKSGRDIRIKITEAKYENGEFKIIRIIPEGKKEMLASDYLRNQK